ncbi:MAG: phosphomannomutase/phosphoglucomutase [Thiopseudomonas sp.]|nr:phosphomannomutase/phosphoglucomutase [Thiopseudomonas sp.]MCK9465682.1 phosphomannomutase/phosphoglucomutase [Thiopseudomonas sp.]
MFRAYDIRGIVDETLTSDTAYWIGRAVGAESIHQGQPAVAVARDGRLSGPELSESLIQGLVEAGCEVTDLGMVPTPVLYFATHTLPATTGVMVTGSHNPANYNGFKIVIDGETLANERITALYQRIKDHDLSTGSGRVEQLDILPAYLERICSDVALAKPLKIVIDCGNGVAGVIAQELFEGLGCEVVPLFCEVDGNFPNHHPDPGKPENLHQLIMAVQQHQANLGIAFDGDADRLGVITNTGQIIFADRLMMLLAKDVVSRNPGADIIFDVKCSRRLPALISGYGGRPIMWKTGHSLMKAKLKQTGALLAGEMSGHIFYKERWYGFDDGLYSAARLLEIIALDTRTSEQIFAAFPTSHSTPELAINVTDESKFKIIDKLLSTAQWGEGKVNTLDGVRVDYPKNWGLVRASNTTPTLVLRFEGDTEAELQKIIEIFRTQLLAIDPTLQWPF